MWSWMESAVARMSLSCREAIRLSDEALERPLALRERAALRIHFAICDLCRRYDRQVALLHEGLHRHGDQFTSSRDDCLAPGEKQVIKNACGDVRP